MYNQSVSDEEFLDWWVLLRKHLASGREVGHWSAAKGYLSGSFEAFPGPYVAQECVRIEGRQRTHIYQRLIFPNDFRAVLGLWDDYRDGRIPRSRVDAATKHSTYVVSIVHWLEEEAGKS
jgi:hypothetical protein